MLEQSLQVLWKLAKGVVPTLSLVSSLHLPLVEGSDLEAVNEAKQDRVMHPVESSCMVVKTSILSIEAPIRG